MLKEQDYLVNYPSCDLELVFVELPKFTKTLAEIETLTEKWMYFLQHTRELEVIPETMGAVPAIRQAFEVANQANLNRDELEELEHQSIFIQDQRNAISLAQKQGQAIGREAGREEGALAMQKAIAMNLLATMDNTAIASLTGLSLEAVEGLR